jgi:hypothetical protein
LGKLPNNELFINCVKEKNKLIGIILCFLRKRKINGISTKTLELIGNVYSPSRGGILLKEKKDEIITAFLNYVKKNANSYWDIAYFQDVSPNSIFYSALINKVSKEKYKYKVSKQFKNIVGDYIIYQNSEDFYNSRPKILKKILELRQELCDINRYILI